MKTKYIFKHGVSALLSVVIGCVGYDNNN